MNPSILIPVLAFAVIAISLFARKTMLKAIPYVCEYWVYFEGEKLPELEPLMDRMVRENPYNRKGRPMIGGREGMLFTDIKLHMGLVKRAKNPKCFRPDLEDSDVIAAPATLALLAPTSAIARVRYISQIPLADRRHLQFMPHLAGAMLDMLDGAAVYDLVTKELYSAEKFGELLSSQASLERPDVQIRTAWILGEDGNQQIRTFGLPKIGILEHVSRPVPADQKTLVEDVFLEAMGLAWLNNSWPEEQTIIHLED